MVQIKVIDLKEIYNLWHAQISVRRIAFKKSN